MARRRIPDLLLEQAAIGELPAGRVDALAGEFGEEAVRAATDQLQRSNTEILERYPVADMALRIAGRLEAAPAAPDARLRGASHRGAARLRLVSRTLRSRPGLFLVPLAAAAAVALAATTLPRLLVSQSSGSPTLEEATRVKGVPRLLVYREESGEAELLQNGDVARARDVIQIKYVPSGREFGAIVSIDGRGAVTLHYPERPGDSTSLGDGSAVALKYAYTLDDAPGFERFLFVTSETEFSASVVLASAQELARGAASSGALRLPEGFEQTSILLRKGE